MTLTQTQITKLGDRIRSSQLLPDDDGLLADYLLSFHRFSEETFDHIVAVIMDARDKYDAANTFFAERSIKSSKSIFDKLNRFRRLRLDQMQDIVGCRILSQSIRDQDIIAKTIISAFGEVVPQDRRVDPSHGYRALHLIIKDKARRYEVQIRTFPQHFWATIVERQIKRYGIDVKYGGGPSAVQGILAELSSEIALYEGVDEAQSHHAREALERKLDEVAFLLGE